MESLVLNHANRYFAHLRKLAALPSVFTRPEDVEHAMAYCKATLSSVLPGHTICEDKGKNLLALPGNINRQEPIVYLSAHVDTVDADKTEWDAPFSPFEPYEDEDELVGRGVSDCKAGVAFQLFLAELAGEGHLCLENLIFTVTFKEEGAGDKSAAHIGRALGKALPVSEKETLLFVLENTVTSGQSPCLGLYTAERSNFVIEVTGPLAELRRTLDRLPSWNPACIYPDTPPESWPEVLTQKGGHVCSVPRDKNRLTDIILSAGDTDLLSAGSPDSFGVIPTEIKRGSAPVPTAHTLVLSNRTFESLASVRRQLSGMTYRELKAFSISPGMDMRDRWTGSTLQRTLEAMGPQPLAVTLDHNTGISDASTIINTMDPALGDRFFPVVMGPGTRSQRQATPQRLTHGKNETFDKKTGIQATATLFNILNRLDVIRSKQKR
ncbi:M20/M25/M40 family metallo-hydrolase [Desulfoluna spongiiphila]|uniref:Peptidase family M20/M25/M40 n=1 Tax=Desulfoluna spongiiphila TaxID=419481 RepID=A0A1G5HVC8_9BACT|nr:M20/M25/M40 family metallo-hydrolase [Desulfoluna spongiiphila]SCY67802.1 Peptidase family M20/M25/M40 [Desulfoluna spongiiphila]